jgi:hypothetical protein
MVIDRIAFLFFFISMFNLVISKFNILFYINLLISFFSNQIFFFFFLLSFVYLFNKNFKSVVIDYLRPYGYIFKQYSYAIPFIIFICLCI